jgi:hypothetical protein
MHLLGKFKRELIQNYPNLKSEVLGFKNDWSDDLAPTISELARFFRCFLYTDPQDTDPFLQAMIQEHNRLTRETRLAVLLHVLKIFTSGIERLKSKLSIDLQLV